jgi:hypothetical protein
MRCSPGPWMAGLSKIARLLQSEPGTPRVDQMSTRHAQGCERIWGYRAA